jgi:hypothetical protein
MMRMTRGWTGLRIAVIALGLLAWIAPGAQAAAMVPNLLDYSTAGAVNTTGINGANAISFVPVSHADIDPTSNIPLGAFQVAALPSGQTTTYHNTPFSITFLPSSFNNTPLAQPSAVTVSGHLNGQVTGSYQSSVKVSFDHIANGTFQLAGGTSTISVLQNDHKLLVPASAGGTTTLEGTITSSGLSNPESPVPEPSTIALFLSTVGGLGLRRFVLVRRQRRHA